VPQEVLGLLQDDEARIHVLPGIVAPHIVSLVAEEVDYHVLLCEKLQKPFVEGDLGENEDVLDGLDWDDLFFVLGDEYKGVPLTLQLPRSKNVNRAFHPQQSSWKEQDLQ